MINPNEGLNKETNQFIEKTGQEPCPSVSGVNLSDLRESLAIIKEAHMLNREGTLPNSDFVALRKAVLERNGIQGLEESSTKTVNRIEFPHSSDRAFNAMRKAAIGQYAGQLHELIVEQIEGQVQQSAQNTKEHMLLLVKKLRELGEVSGQDARYLEELIELVCNQPETISLGLRGIEVLYSKAMEDEGLGNTAVSILGVGYRSALHAVSKEGKTATNMKPKLWEAVEQDVLGALAGAQTAASIVSLPTVAAVGLVGAVGISGALMPPVGAAVLVAGIVSGLRWASLISTQEG